MELRDLLMMNTALGIETIINGVKYSLERDKVCAVISDVGLEMDKIVLHEGTEIIGESGFSHYQGRSIKLPKGLIEIRNYAFYQCTQLKNITIPEGVTYIGDYSFADCYSLEYIKIGEGVQCLEDYAFDGCLKLKQIQLPQSLSNIGNAVFSYCRSLTSIVIPVGIEKLGGYIFIGCSNLKNVWIPARFNCQREQLGIHPCVNLVET